MPTDVPTASEMKQATTKSPASSRFGGMTASASWTDESTAPIARAVEAKAPARMKMRHMVMMSASPMPCAKSSILLLSDARRFSSSAVAEATRNATGIGTL